MLTASVSVRTVGLALRLPNASSAPARCPSRLACYLKSHVGHVKGRRSTSFTRCQPPEPRHSNDSPTRDEASWMGAASNGGSLAASAALALLLPLADPAAASAAEQAAGSGSAMYWTCIGMGSATVITTLLFTSRFLLSYFPGLEKRARQRPRAVLLRALTAADPLLDPITKGFFRMTEQGDLNYGAMALLAFISAIMAVLVGDDGMLVDRVPDLGMLALLRYLVYFQHMTLLPMWVFVVFRYFLLI